MIFAHCKQAETVGQTDRKRDRRTEGDAARIDVDPARLPYRSFKCPQVCVCLCVLVCVFVCVSKGFWQVVCDVCRAK